MSAISVVDNNDPQTTMPTNNISDPEVLCNSETPRAQDLFHDMTLVNQILIPVCTLFVLFNIALFIEETHFVLHHFSINNSRRSMTLVILAIYPVYSCTSFLAFLVPRSATINELVGTVYFGYCLYTFTELLTAYYGGRPAMLTTLQNAKMGLASLPCCCLCLCLPTVPFNENNYRRMISMVMQTAILKPILALIAAVVWTNGSFGADQLTPYSVALYVALINMCSTFVAIYGLVQLLRVCLESLKKYSIRAKFFSLQCVMILTVTADCVFVFLVSIKVISCNENFSASDRAVRLYNVSNIFMMLPLSLVARWVYLQKPDCTESLPYIAHHGPPQELTVNSEPQGKYNKDFSMLDEEGPGEGVQGSVIVGNGIQRDESYINLSSV